MHAFTAAGPEEADGRESNGRPLRRARTRCRFRAPRSCHCPHHHRRTKPRSSGTPPAQAPRSPPHESRETDPPPTNAAEPSPKTAPSSGADSPAPPSSCPGSSPAAPKAHRSSPTAEPRPTRQPWTPAWRPTMRSCPAARRKRSSRRTPRCRPPPHHPDDLDELQGWTLHQLPHSALTHDAEDGTSTPMSLTRSRQSSVRPLERYGGPASTPSPSTSPSATLQPAAEGEPGRSGLQDHPVAPLGLPRRSPGWWLRQRCALTPEVSAAPCFGSQWSSR